MTKKESRCSHKECKQPGKEEKEEEKNEAQLFGYGRVGQFPFSET